MKIIFCVLISSLVLSSFAFEFLHLNEMFRQGDDLPTVDKVDINKFKGHWYEIARLPHKKERNCICSQEQVILNDNKIIANNTCLKESLFGEQDVEEFEMIPLDDTYAKFKTDAVSDYYIIDLDQENYQYAMIGDPTRDFLWISARHPTLGKTTLFNLVKKAKNLGFDVDKLVYQAQICGDIFNEAFKSQLINEEEEEAEEAAFKRQIKHEEEEEAEEEEKAEEEEEVEEEEEQQKELPTVDQVDLNRFIGHWYEIARLPNKGERGCLCTQQRYQLQDSKVHVESICRKDSIDAELSRCESNIIPEDETNAKFRAEGINLELYVVDLDEDNYEYALIADPKRRYLWIKSRNQLVDYDTLKRLVDKARDLDFDVDKLIYTAQLCGNDFENEEL